MNTIIPDWKTKYEQIFERHTHLMNEGYETHDFGIVDAKGRTVGAIISFALVEIEHYTAEVYNPKDEQIRPEGTYYAFRPQLMRGGKAFGPIQSMQHFATEEARFRAVEKYLAGAKKRAQKAKA